MQYIVAFLMLLLPLESADEQISYKQLLSEKVAVHGTEVTINYYELLNYNGSKNHKRNIDSLSIYVFSKLDKSINMLRLNFCRKLTYAGPGSSRILQIKDPQNILFSYTFVKGLFRKKEIFSGGKKYPMDSIKVEIKKMDFDLDHLKRH